MAKTTTAAKPVSVTLGGVEFTAAPEVTMGGARLILELEDELGISLSGGELSPEDKRKVFLTPGAPGKLWAALSIGDHEAVDWDSVPLAAFNGALELFFGGGGKHTPEPKSS